MRSVFIPLLTATLVAGLFVPTATTPAQATTTPGIDGRIAYVRYSEETGSEEVFTIDPDGTDERRITTTPETYPSTRIYSPSWSPDGTKIAFKRTETPGEGRFVHNIWVHDLATGEEIQITDNAENQRGPSDPDWAPGGAIVVFRDEKEIHSYDLYRDRYRARTAYTEHANVDPRADAGAAGSPSWSPTGRRIAFAGEYGHDLYYVKRRGGIHRVRRLRGMQGTPSWSPDARWLLFRQLRNYSDETPSIWKMKRNGKGVDQVVGRGCCPQWSPSGKRFVYQTWHQDPDTGRTIHRIFTADTEGRDREFVAEGKYPDWQPRLPGGCTVRTTNRSDDILATPLDDVICTRGGKDYVRAGGGDDVIMSGAKRDRILARHGDDLIYGQRGHDILRGGRGHDQIRGNKGRDRLYGGRGRDVLRGGSGNDRCHGGRRDSKINC